MPAPRNPWIARQKIISVLEEAKPHKRLEKVKPAAEIANSSRVPSARDRKPDRGMAMTSAIRYAVCTQETSVELADRPAWMSESEAETTWMSRIAMNMPNTMMMNANSRFGTIRSDGACVPIMAGVAVVAFAMFRLCFRLSPRTHKMRDARSRRHTPHPHRIFDALRPLPQGERRFFAATTVS